MSADNYDPRGAIHQAAGERAARRSLGGIAPPPRPRPVSPGPSSPSQPKEPPAGVLQVPTATVPAHSDPNEYSPLVAAPSPGVAPDDARPPVGEGPEKLLGKQRGNLRYVRLYLSGPAAELIEDIRRQSRQTRGVIVMAAVRMTYTEIRTAFKLAPDPKPGPFGLPRASRRRRYAVEHPVQVTVSVTPDEALGLQELSEVTGLSVSAIASEAMERALRNAAELVFP